VPIQANARPFRTGKNRSAGIKVVPPAVAATREQSLLNLERKVNGTRIEEDCPKCTFKTCVSRDKVKGEGW
jgi:hypothetical protein